MDPVRKTKPPMADPRYWMDCILFTAGFMWNVYHTLCSSAWLRMARSICSLHASTQYLVPSFRVTTYRLARGTSRKVSGKTCFSGRCGGSQISKRVTLRSAMSVVIRPVPSIFILRQDGSFRSGCRPIISSVAFFSPSLSLRMSPIIGPRFAMRSFALCEKCR